MGSPVGTIGDAGFPRLRRLGARAEGVIIPEVAEMYGVSDDTARRFVLRAVRRGILKRTDERRRRADIFGPAARGAGGVVYRAVKTEERDAWADWRIWRRQRAGSGERSP